MIVGLKADRNCSPDVTGFVKIAKRPAKGRKGQELAITPTEELMEWIEGRNEIGECPTPHHVALRGPSEALGPDAPARLPHPT